MTDHAAGEPQSPLLDLSAIWRVLWSRKLPIVGVAVGFVAIAAFYVVTTRPTFTATAVIFVDPRNVGTTETDNVLPGIGSDSAAIASQLAVITSRELLGAVFESEGLFTDPEFAEPDFFGSLLGNRPSYAVAFDNFVNHAWVEREGLTYVLDINFTSRDPDKAARIANAIVAGYIAAQIAEKSAANAEVSDLLRGRIDELQQDVLEAERAVQDFRVANGIFNSASGGTQVQAQIDQFNGQLVAAQEAARQADVRYQQAVEAGTTPLGLISLTEILSSASAEKLRDDYNLRSTALASAEASMGPRHPTLLKMRAELDQVETLMVREIERIVEELRATRDAQQSVVARIEGDIAALQTDANQSNRMEVELRQLERNADASRQVLEQFLRRSEETSQFQTLQFSDARVITRATSPLRATWPKGSLLLGVAGALGLAVGAGVALLMGAPAGRRTSVPRSWRTVPVPFLRRRRRTRPVVKPAKAATVVVEPAPIAPPVVETLKPVETVPPAPAQAKRPSGLRRLAGLLPRPAGRETKPPKPVAEPPAAVIAPAAAAGPPAPIVWAEPVVLVPQPVAVPAPVAKAKGSAWPKWLFPAAKPPPALPPVAPKTVKRVVRLRRVVRPAQSAAMTARRPSRPRAVPVKAAE